MRGKDLKNLREWLGLSQRQLVIIIKGINAVAGIDVQGIGRVEAGQYDATPNNASYQLYTRALNAWQCAGKLKEG